MTYGVFTCLAVLGIVCSTTVSGADRASAVDLRCEHLVNPLGIDETQPHLSWRIESRIQERKQTACQVLVSRSSEMLGEDRGDHRDSGKVLSEKSQHVVYQGEALRSRSVCYWKVRVWDKAGKPSAWSPPGRWTVGLLESRDWVAQWIRSPHPTGEIQGNPAPLFRKAFALVASPGSALVTIHSPAYFESYIDGAKVGADVVTPVVSDQKLVTFTSTYNVGRYVKQGENCIGRWLRPCLPRSLGRGSGRMQSRTLSRGTGPLSRIVKTYSR